VSDYVLDASALLALLNAERGADLVQDLLPRCIISAVNLSEVVTRLSILNMPEHEIRETLSILGLEIVAFDKEQALLSGLLTASTRPFGLSLGDRACLALAIMINNTAVSADRAWQDLDIGVNIKLIR
jgi:ribonuclease VapC